MNAFLRQQFALLVTTAHLIALFGWRVPNFLTSSNLLDLAQQIGVNTILAFGMTLVILIGGIDLSVGALVALVGTVTTFCMVHTTAPDGSVIGLGWSVFPAMLAGFATAALFGLFHGVAVSKTQMPAFIVTLGTMLVARGLALRFNEGRPLSLPGSQETYLFIGNGRIFDAVPMPVVILLAVYLLTAALLHLTVFGRHLYAIGDNRLAALYSGIPVSRCEIIVYILAALLTATAGMIHASQLYGAEPASGQGFELNAIAAAVVGGASLKGGRGTMTGTLLGAIIIGILDKGLNQAGVHFSLQYMIKGGVILAAVWWDARKAR
ncbi:ABC transporter permease [Roseimicrobium sp. ORNL1]|uniref:ABC transporter permease n=1 Tax=Roseimicrobium sp. ORNL1 TaxID=2711231 RepID=UPI0013E12F3D|nr:ABC transporter permease [Roseimicrobium sp. ORNL1]QIF03236.1 ABC transporter permease [Roseimicrobium sp. ORNL1]